ncbi:MAG TPA: YezD family protein [Actinomycetota bacterium]|nr:YezD family protein [Actinomycetota bacterium]
MSPNDNPDDGPDDSPDERPFTREELDLALRVIRSLRKLRYGSLHLQVHAGNVVQLDVSEKLRMLPGSGDAGAPPPVDEEGADA